MQYNVGFERAVSAELEQLLHAVQGQLNGRDFHARVSQDTQASGDLPASGVIAPPGGGKCNCDPLTEECQAGAHGGHGPLVPCPAGAHGGHGPLLIVIGAAGLVVGLVIGFLFGKRSGRALR